MAGINFIDQIIGEDKTHTLEVLEEIVEICMTLDKETIAPELALKTIQDAVRKLDRNTSFKCCMIQKEIACNQINDAETEAYNQMVDAQEWDEFT